MQAHKFTFTDQFFLWVPVVPIVLYLNVFHSKYYFLSLTKNYCYFPDRLIDLFPLLILIYVSCMYGVSRRNIQFNDSGNYMKALFLVATVALTLTTFVLGLHTDLISDYDKNRQNEREYKWFETSEILKFPLTQYKLKKYCHVQHVNHKAKNNRKFDLQCFIIDKTKSYSNATNNRRFKKLEQKIDNKLYNYHPKDERDSFDIIDKTLLCLVDDICNHTNYSKIAVFLYFGKSDKDSLGKIVPVISDDNNFFFERSAKYETIKNNYKKAKQVKVTNQKTNINDLIYDINYQLSLDWAKSIHEANVHIISDFNDDDSLALDDHNYYYRNIKKLISSDKLSKLSLITFPTTKITPVSYLTKKSFFESCKNISAEYINLYNISFEHPENDLSYILTDLTDDFKEDNSQHEYIKFHYPYYSNYSDNSAECILHIDSFFENAKIKFSCLNLKDDEFIKLTCSDKDSKKDKLLIANENDFFAVPTNDVHLKLLNAINLESKKLYLDIIYDGVPVKKRFKIELTSMLPYTTIMYLFMLYSIIIVCFSLMIFLSSFIHTHIPSDAKAKNYLWWERKGYLLIMGIVIAFNYWYISLIYTVNFALIVYSITSILLILCIRNYFIKSWENHSWRISNEN